MTRLVCPPAGEKITEVVKDKDDKDKDNKYWSRKKVLTLTRLVFLPAGEKIRELVKDKNDKDKEKE